MRRQKKDASQTSASKKVKDELNEEVSSEITSAVPITLSKKAAKAFDDAEKIEGPVASLVLAKM